MKNLLLSILVAFSLSAIGQAVTVGRLSVCITGHYDGQTKASLENTSGALVKSWSFSGVSEVITLSGIPRCTLDTPVKYKLIIARGVDTIFNKTIEIKRVQTAESFTCKNYPAQAPFKFNYLIYQPESFFHSGLKIPLLLTFHGNGQKGNNELNKLRSTFIPRIIEQNRILDFVVVSPQTNGSMPKWSVKWYKELLDSLHAKGIDTSIVFVAGYSGGGEGLSTYLLNHSVAGLAEFQAVLGPLQGSPCVLKDAKVWGFHALDDKTISPNITKNFILNLKKCPSNPRMSLYPTGGHSYFGGLAGDSLFRYFKGEIQ